MKPIEFKAEFSMTPEEVRQLVAEEAKKRVPGFEVRSVRFVVRDVYDNEYPPGPPSSTMTEVEIVMEKM